MRYSIFRNAGKAILILLILFSIFALPSCKPSKSNYEIFQEHYEANLERCVRVVVDNKVDSVAASERCAYYLNTLYEIDSTFVKMKGKELDKFLKSNIELLDNGYDALNE